MKLLRNTISKYLLIVLFVSYYLGGIAFTHVHHFPTYTIIHSHPFLPSADGLPHHSHTSEAFDTIELLSGFLLDTVFLFFLSGMLWVFLGVFFREHRYAILIRIFRYGNLRAPPAFI